MNNCLFVLTGCICFMLGLIIAWYFTGHKYCLLINNLKKENAKNRIIVRLYDVWMMIDAEKKEIGQFLSKKEIKTVVIYGMSFLGIRLYKKLEGSEVNVIYAMDRDPQVELPGIKIYVPGEEKIEDVDAVIVTAITSFDMIKKELSTRGYGNIYALDEILYEMIADKDEVEQAKYDKRL